MPIQEDDPRSAYVQIADELRERIQGGELKAGEKIPSLRKIAEEFKVAQLTAQKASKILEAEGLVVRRKGRGFIVRSEPGKDPQEETAVLAHQLASVQAQLKHISPDVGKVKKLTPHVDDLKKLAAQVNELSTLPARVKQLEELVSRLENLETAIAKLQQKTSK